ncbi:phage tail fiber protein, partial [Acinetobacter nosocomialis]
MEVGAFGIGLASAQKSPDGETTLNADLVKNGEVCAWGGVPDVGYGAGLVIKQSGDSTSVVSRIIFSLIDSRVFYVRTVNSHQIFQFLTSANTTVDANGFIKSASPVVKLFADKIELNEEAA